MSEALKRRRGLGRGLAALLGDQPPAEPPARASATTSDGGEPAGHAGGTRQVPIEQLHPNLGQPRQHYDEEALAALTQSITEQGVLQPLIVRPHPDQPGEFQIVAGERRWRAAQRAHLVRLPVIVRQLDDRQMLELAIVENVQREDLTALEEAEAYQRLGHEFGYSQEQIAKAVGKSRSHIANMQRLLALPPPVKALMGQGKLSAGHGRALLAAPNPAQLGSEAVEAGWSVRELERRAQQAAKKPPGKAKARRSAGKDADTLKLEHDLTMALGLKVVLNHHGAGGVLELRYQTLEQLDDLVARLRRVP
jgi:ParB family chromosome partitioning protein